MKTHTFLIITFLSLTLFSCTNTESRTEIDRKDIFGIWRQKSPDSLLITNPSGVNDFWIRDEIFNLKNDLNFDLTGQLLFRTGNSGMFEFKNNDTEIDFTLIADKTDLPDGGQIQILENQYWTWNILDFVEDTLEVDVVSSDPSDTTKLITQKQFFVKQR